MKRLALLALLLWSCDDTPVRMPVDAGPMQKDASATDTGVQPDATPMEDAGVEDGGSEPDGGAKDAGTGDGGVTPTGLCRGRPCLTSVGNAAEWGFVSGPAGPTSRCDLVEETMFIVPKSQGTALDEPIYVDVKTYRTLYAFLKEEMSAELPDLDPDVYYEMFERSDTRAYWTGRIYRVEGGGYAFTPTADFYFGSPPDEAAIEAIRDLLAESFTFPLAYTPQTTTAIRDAEQFSSPTLDVLLPEPCAGEGCADPNAFCVIVPAGTELCSQFAENRDVPGELAARFRLEIASGSHALPTQPGTTQMTLFTGGVFGPDQTPIQAPTPGTLTVQDFGGSLSYQYDQTVTAGANTLELTWTVYDSSRNPFILREPFLTSDVGLYGAVNGSTMFPDGQLIGGSCDAAGLPLYFAEGELANGDGFRLEYRHQIPFAGSGPLVLTGAEVRLGGQRIEVRDDFQLVYAGVHHNWDNQFVVIFDQPLTYMGHPVYGIWIDEADYTCCPVDGVYTLDQNLEKLDALQVTSYLRAPSSF